MTKIAVTGASGFVGGHVVAALRKRGLEPVLVRKTAAEGWHGCDYTAGEVLDYDALGRPEAVIHLAWGGLPNYRSLHHFEVELPAQFRMLRGLVEAGLPRLVGVGTCLEYGMQAGELGEDLAPQPDNAYAFAKDALRRELEFLQRVSPFALTWARLFYVYGDGQAANSLLPALARAVADGAPHFDMSAGEQLRDFLPVEAAAEALVDLALLPEGGGVVNVCSGRPISVKEQVEQWKRKHGWTIDLNLGHYPYPDWEPMEFWGSRAKLDGLLDRAGA